ncbi:MAG: FAD-dependent oxidoreductase [Oscillospiraceae bacterium]|nr:FAD-dependent oxidoreductase [Oscillospiraceae bacterium]
MLYDVIIIGAGPAGMTAALYARRADRSVLLIEKETFGGQITFSPKVENFPTHIAISGSALADQMLAQVQAQGADVELDTVVEISKTGDLFVLTGEFGSYEAKSVILATGAKHRVLGLDNESALVGAGVCYCAVCDGAFYRGQKVAVIGGGNTALQDALLLAELCEKVTIVQNLPVLTGEQVLQTRIGKLDNVEVITNATVAKLCGEDALTGVVIQTAAGEQSLDVTGVFIAIGQQPDNQAFAAYAALDDYGYVKADERCLTDTAGLFVAGDCRTKAVRQIVTATADGATAALAACRYLDTL